MDLLLICRDATSTSVISNLLLAIEAKKKGTDVGVLVAGEALAAATGGAVFFWPQGLLGQEYRYLLADNAEKVGLENKGGRGQGRQIDVSALIKKAGASGVPMFASGTWVTLLGLGGKLPQGIKVTSPDDELKMLKEAKTVVGSL